MNKHGETDEYFTYSGGIEAKFPGYALDRSNKNQVKNVSDQTIDIDKHCKLLLTKFSD
mgnify:FL=1